MRSAGGGRPLVRGLVLAQVLVLVLVGLVLVLVLGRVLGLGRGGVDRDAVDQVVLVQQIGRDLRVLEGDKGKGPERRGDEDVKDIAVAGKVLFDDVFG